MNYQISPEAQELVDAMLNAPEGQIKSASAAATDYTRRRIRESGVFRLCFPLKTASQDMMAYLPNQSEDPIIIEEMEPDSFGAKVINFDDTPDSQEFYGSKYIVEFAKLTTPEYVKRVDKLKAYKYDLRQIITDNSLSDLRKLEDERFYQELDRICGNRPGARNSRTGLVQYTKLNTHIGKLTYPIVPSFLQDRQLNLGQVIMNRNTFREFTNLGLHSTGDKILSETFSKGADALEATIMNIKHVVTSHQEMLPNGMLYLLTEPNYLGKGYILEDTTVHVERKREFIRFYADEKIGFTIANLGGVHKLRFTKGLFDKQTLDSLSSKEYELNR